MTLKINQDILSTRFTKALTHFSVRIFLNFVPLCKRHDSFLQVEVKQPCLERLVRGLPFMMSANTLGNWTPSPLSL